MNSCRAKPTCGVWTSTNAQRFTLQRQRLDNGHWQSMFAFFIDWWLFSKITNPCTGILWGCWNTASTWGRSKSEGWLTLTIIIAQSFYPCLTSTPGPTWEHRPPPCRVHKPCSCCHTSSQVGRRVKVLVKGWGLRPAWKRRTHFLECWTCSPQGRHRLDHLGQQRAHTSPACSGASIVLLTL